uniref:Tail protein n=1 Tax=viral metagenome TaxID=1070528 RepID=A0A6M3KIA1_9ZZZZ
MLKVGIRFNVRDFTRMLASLQGLKDQANKEAQNAPDRASQEYRQTVIANILSNKYASIYAPYNAFYEEWKAKHGKRAGFWNLFGDLVRAITVVRTAGVKQGRFGRGKTYMFFAGVPEGVLDSGRKSWYGEGNIGASKSIAWYGRIMEYGGRFTTRKGGTQFHPPRPVFTPTANVYFSRDFQKIGAEAHKRITARWRKQ